MFPSFRVGGVSKQTLLGTAWETSLGRMNELCAGHTAETASGKGAGSKTPGSGHTSRTDPTDSPSTSSPWMTVCVQVKAT